MFSELRTTDEIAVEATCNTRWFAGQVQEKVRRVVVVNPREFEVVKNSVRENRPSNATNLARFAQSGFVAGSASQGRSRTGAEFGQYADEIGQTENVAFEQDSSVSCVDGKEIRQKQFSFGKKGLAKVLERQWSEIERIELEIIIEQIRSLKASIKKLEKVISNERKVKRV